MTWATAAIELIGERFESARDPERATPMAAYMKDHFAFYGIGAPERRRLVGEAVAELPKPGPDDAVSFAHAAWALPEREWHYVGADLLTQVKRRLAVQHLSDVEALIVTKSWWDTVDSLCRHPAGDIVSRHMVARSTMDDWLCGDQMWLQRSAILHMETWRGDEVDVRWLFDACRRHAHQTEFFIRKAIGWALRSYAHSSPDAASAVRSFVADMGSELSGLSQREALKRVRH